MSALLLQHMLRASDAMVVANDSGAVTFTTPRARVLLDLPQDVRGQDVTDVMARQLPGQDLPGPSRERLGRLATSRGTPLDVAVLPLDDGGSAWFVAPAEGGADRPDESVALLSKVLATARDAVLVTAAEPIGWPGPIIVWGNRALEHHTGYAVSELLGRTPRVLQGPGTRREDLDGLRDELDAWRACQAEVLNYRKDGTPFWVEFDVVPLADERGWFTHWVSVQREVTDRHLAQDARDAERDLVQTIMDSLPVQTAMLDRSGMIVAVNRPWHDVWRSGSDGTEPDWRDINYLEACRVAADDAGASGSLEAGLSYAGIAAVLAGTIPSFGMDYSCPVAGQDRWFHLQATTLLGREGALVTHTDITDRKLAEAELSHQANHDILTGLPNRKLLLERLSHELDRSRVRGTRTAVAFLDLDNFKDVNDAYGHGYGDRVLDAVGLRLREAVSPGDLVARVGGDEYVLMLTNLRWDWDGESWLAGLRSRVSQPLDLGVASVRPSMSVGMVTSPPHAGDAEAVLRDADTAMYASKRLGRDRWTMFSQSVRDTAIARAVSVERLAEALAQDRFVLEYQPLVDLRTSTTIGTEALLRLRAADGFLIPPRDFLPTLDNGPLATEVGHWVLDHALGQLARWNRTDPRLTMTVNVSARQLGRGVLPAEVADLLASHGVKATRLVLELTEEMLIDAATDAASELRALREIGVRLAVDDFGTGYSSLSYLSTLPIDVLKIDRSFVSRSASPRGQSLLGAVAGLADVVGAVAVAEGVETAAQLATVRRLGIPLAQGFLLGRPAQPGPQPPRAHLSGRSLRSRHLRRTRKRT